MLRSNAGVLSGGWVGVEGGGDRVGGGGGGVGGEYMLYIYIYMGICV